MKERLKKYLVEMIGTFFLVLTVGMTALCPTAGVVPPLAIGAVFMVMVYAGCHISGGHYNPAISLAATLRGALPLEELLHYWAFQLFGAALASAAVVYFTYGKPVTPASFDLYQLLFAEFLFTFALCYVVLQTATSKSNEGNSYYGLAIGFTVLVGAFCVGGTACIGAFNPAVAFAAGILSLTTCKLVCSTILANLVAGVCAALVYKFVYSSENK